MMYYEYKESILIPYCAVVAEPDGLTLPLLVARFSLLPSNRINSDDTRA